MMIWAFSRQSSRRALEGFSPPRLLPSCCRLLPSILLMTMLLLLLSPSATPLLRPAPQQKAAVHRLQTGLQEAPAYTSPVRARTKSLQLTTSTTASTAVGSTTAQQGSGQAGSMLQIRSPNSANSKAMSRKQAYDTIQSRVDSKGEGEKFQPHEIADLALAVGLTEDKVKGVLIEMRMRRHTARTKSPGNKSRSSHGASPSAGNSRGGTSRR